MVQWFDNNVLVSSCPYTVCESSVVDFTAFSSSCECTGKLEDSNIVSLIQDY